jgi:hypothetical protein
MRPEIRSGSGGRVGGSSPAFSPSHRVCWTDASTCEKSGLAGEGDDITLISGGFLPVFVVQVYLVEI